MEIINFIIDHIDPLGQGVFKNKDQIYFIPKTLPTEEGEAKIVNKSRGVNFCELIKLKKVSPKRIFPQCPHYESCQGCHFLHTDYDHEIIIKKKSLLKILSPLADHLKIDLTPSSQRFGTRNRIQLHYDAHFKKIGFINKNKKGIIPVESCLQAKPIIQNELKEVYLKSKEKNFFPKTKAKGHLEISVDDNEQIKQTWNRPYSDGGFTQVNNEVNQSLIKKLETTMTHQLLKNKPDRKLNIIDLFGGSGNLTQSFKNHHCLIFDTYINKKKLGPHQKGHILNLNNKASFKLIQEELQGKVDLIIIDPPRSGFKNIDEILPFEAELIVYVSCAPQTLKRDLIKISGKYELLSVDLFDMFPGTFHFETFVILKKKS